MAIDTLKVAKRLREAGFSDTQAEAVVVTMQEAAAGADLATKGDLSAVRSELKADVAELRAELKAGVARLDAGLAAVRSELRET